MNNIRVPPQFENARRGQNEILRLRPAWPSYWGSAIAALIVVSVWVVQRGLFDEVARALGIPEGLSALGLGIGLAPILVRVVYHRYTHAYEIENGRKIRLVAGFISRVKREFPLTDKVQTDMGQSILGRVLNYGTLAFWTGDDRSQLIWRDAPDPDRVISFLDQLKSGQAEAAPFSNPGSPSAPYSAGKADDRMPAPPTLKEAKSTKYTHYGRAPDYKTAAEIVARRIQTPLGNYIDNDDGTVTDEAGGLMWMRAPWGMVWTGAGYAGEAILVNWNTATDLFGRGTEVGYNVGSSMAYMGHEKRAASEHRHGYKPGRCVVHAAGYKDWRLPTAAELDRMSPHTHSNTGDQGDEAFDLTRDERDDWQWFGKRAQAVFARLYPELFQAKSYLWSATGLGGGLAWAYDGGLPPGDFKTGDSKAVLFVRKIKEGEYKPGEMEDEELGLV